MTRVLALLALWVLQTYPSAGQHRLPPGAPSESLSLSTGTYALSSQGIQDPAPRAERPERDNPPLRLGELRTFSRHNSPGCLRAEQAGVSDVPGRLKIIVASEADWSNNQQE